MLPTENPTRDEIREAILEAVAEHPGHPFSFIGKKAKLRFGLRVQNSQHDGTFLGVFNELIRQGVLRWGGERVESGDAPRISLSHKGRCLLESYAQSPRNPEGYVVALLARAPLSETAESYIREALATFAAECHRATVVLVGAASEALSLDLRDSLVERLDAAGAKVRRGLRERRIKRVLEAIEAELGERKREMPADLRESFEGAWLAMASLIRQARNDAGHPRLLSSADEAAAHRSLLLFPDLAELTGRLRSWISTM